jgi:ubiquinone/menaquinone biosynthesis C-methylase UbiE
MVEACRRRFASLEFLCVDATDLRIFSDRRFDVVVFSFNGIDYIPTDEARARCLLEVARVLRPGGRFIFSSHNAKYIGWRPNTTVRKAFVTNSSARLPNGERKTRARAAHKGTG